MAMALDKVDERLMVVEEFLGCFEQFLKLDGGHVQLFVGVEVFYRTGPEMETGVDAAHYFLQFLSPVYVLLEEFEVAGGELLEGFIGFTGRPFVAEVFLGEVDDGNLEKVGQFEQVADFGFCGPVFVGGDVAPVEAHPAGQLFLAHFQALSQQAKILLQVNWRWVLVAQIHTFSCFLDKLFRPAGPGFRRIQLN